MVGNGFSPKTNWSSPRSRRFNGVVAGVVAIAVVTAAIFTFGGSGSTSNAGLAKVLLTPSEMSTAAGADFVVDTSKDNSSDNSDSSCTNNVSAPAGSNHWTKATASIQYIDHGNGTGAAEEIDKYASGKAAVALSAIKSAFSTCQSFKDGTDLVNVQVLPPPVVSGSDDTFAIEEYGTTAGHQIRVDVLMARFNDSIVTVGYFGLAEVFGGFDQTDPVGPGLLEQAALKAKSAL